MKIPVGLSNHHVHITREDANILFGEGYELKAKRNLNQIGQFAAEEVLDVIVNNKKIEHLRIVGPYRNYCQVELLKKDFEYLETNEVWSDSGKLDGTLSFKLIGPNGSVKHDKGAFIANNHIHFSKEDLDKFNVNVNDKLSVITKDGVIVNDLTVKSDETCKLEVHINKDEAEVINMQTFDEVEIYKKI